MSWPSADNSKDATANSFKTQPPARFTYVSSFSAIRLVRRHKTKPSTCTHIHTQRERESGSGGQRHSPANEAKASGATATQGGSFLARNDILITVSTPLHPCTPYPLCCLLLLLLPRPLVNRLPHPVLSSNELCEFAREPRDLRCSVLLCCFAFSCCCFGLTSFGFLCRCRPGLLPASLLLLFCFFFGFISFPFAGAVEIRVRR